MAASRQTPFRRNSLWIAQLDDLARRPLFADRILAITEDVIVQWKTLVVQGQCRGHTFGQPDLFIAALAALENLVVVTRDVSEFIVAEVPGFDPWSGMLHVGLRQFSLKPPASIETVIDLL